MFDVTTRSIAAKVVKAAAPIKTIVKYEMYFLLGIVSTAGLASLVLVTGADMLVSGVASYGKFQAAKKLSKDFLAEHEKTKEYAHTLHLKLEEFFIAGAKVKWKNYGGQLPKTIVTDEKTQAQLSGVLAGKSVLSPKSFTVWTAVFTILTTAVIKSATKSADAYAKTLDNRYRPIVNDLQSVDWNNRLAVSAAAIKFKGVLEESGVEVSNEESVLILTEVHDNSDKVEASLRRIEQSFRAFQTSFSD